MFAGNRHYQLVAFINSADTMNKNTQRLFDELKITALDTGFVWRSKTALLLNDLRSGDSSVRAAARQVLQQTTFVRADLPLLYQALLHDYKDEDEGYMSVGARICLQIKQLQDDTARQFVLRHYAAAAAIPQLQYRLLGLLLNGKTQADADRCKQLLLASPPTSPNSLQLISAYHDSVSLFANWYPDMLRLVDDRYMGPLLWQMTLSALDTGQVTLSMLAPYTDRLYQRALAEMDSLKRNKDYNEHIVGYLLRLLAKCNVAKANAWLKEHIKHLSEYIATDLLAEFARHNSMPYKADLLRIAASDYYRSKLYSDLQKIGKASWFPAQYASQQQLARSSLVNVMDEDESEAKLQYIGARTALYKGQQQVFHMFKIIYSYDGSTSLGIAGPFSLDKKDLRSNYEATTYSYEGYSPSQLNAQFKELLKTTQE
jgi:hypothetical protein